MLRYHRSLSIFSPIFHSLHAEKSRKDQPNTSTSNAAHCSHKLPCVSHYIRICNALIAISRLHRMKSTTKPYKYISTFLFVCAAILKTFIFTFIVHLIKCRFGFYACSNMPIAKSHCGYLLERLNSPIISHIYWIGLTFHTSETDIILAPQSHLAFVYVSFCAATLFMETG